VISYFFPAPNEIANYCNREDLFSIAISNQPFILDQDLLPRLLATGRPPQAGDVKYVFVTKSGPGPTHQPVSESLLDPVTGLPNEPGPLHKRMKIDA
jgi:hypothetical protein